MKIAELQGFKDRLMLMRARLVGDVNAMADYALNKTGGEAGGNLSTAPIHMADLGTDAYEQEFTISRIENEGELLELIDNALKRIAKGEYGLCAECGAKIPKARLNAIPQTPYCIKCAEQNEG
jgi:DnaK suppressor protein